jgi:hypothetical protein
MRRTSKPSRTGTLCIPHNFLPQPYQRRHNKDPPLTASKAMPVPSKDKSEADQNPQELVTSGKLVEEKIYSGDTEDMIM